MKNKITYNELIEVLGQAIIALEGFSCENIEYFKNVLRKAKEV